MEIGKNSIPKPNSEIISRMVDNEAVLVMPKLGKVKVLNEVGAEIWELIDGKRSVQDISYKICTQFEIDKKTAEKDAIKFITDLVDKKIVTI